MPKHNVKATFLLGSIRCPRTARPGGDKGDAFGPEAHSFISRMVFQRDVEVVFESNDKSGGFVGSMYCDGRDIAELLVKEGLARLDGYATPTKPLMAAEEEAKRERMNVRLADLCYVTITASPSTDQAYFNRYGRHMMRKWRLRALSKLSTPPQRGRNTSTLSFPMSEVTKKHPSHSRCRYSRRMAVSY